MYILFYFFLSFLTSFGSSILIGSGGSATTSFCLVPALKTIDTANRIEVTSFVLLFVYSP